MTPIFGSPCCCFADRQWGRIGAGGSGKGFNLIEIGIGTEGGPGQAGVAWLDFRDMTDDSAAALYAVLLATIVGARLR